MKQVKTFYKYILALVVLLSAQAQAQIVYQCDFENPTQNATWNLNVGTAASKCANNWYIGAPGNFSTAGANGLYIASQNDPNKAAYVRGTKAMAVVASVDIDLAPGNYNLDFDWRCQGSQSTGFVVAWVERSKTTNSNNQGTYSHAAIVPLDNVKLSKKTSWTPQRFNFNVTAADSQGKLVIVWDQALEKANNPSACIDNIVITQACNCNAPTSLKYDEKTAKLSWRGPNGATYDVRDYCANDGSLTEYNGIAANNLGINLVAEGTHYFYVRSVCGDGCFSEWVSVQTWTWIPGKRCIDFMDIGANVNNTGKCYTGLFEDFITNNRQGTLAYVNNGSDRDDTQHCLHTDLNETDPNTSDGGGLRTVPEGEIASVRLGAYTSSGQSSRVEYKYLVQNGVSDLLILHYAVVSQTGGHEEDIQPRFQLDILDGRGKPVTSTCCHKEFVPGFGETNNWHIEDDIYWCDWDSVTVSLRPYVGQTLTIRLTATRCTYDTHWTKAYFTINCRDGGLEGLSCGDTKTDHFEAPAGFSYVWYNEQTKVTVQDSVARHGQVPYTTNNGQVLHIDSISSEIYILECHATDDYGCFYALTANPNPRWPIIRGDYKLVSQNCENLVNFVNNSVVNVINRETGEPMASDEPIHSFMMDYGDGSPIEYIERKDYVTHTYPTTGGKFFAKMTALMDGGCTADTIFEIDVPDILHTGTTIHTYLKINTPYTGKLTGILHNSPCDSLIIDSVTSVNEYGCDAPDYEYIHYFNRWVDTTHTVICYGDSVYFPYTKKWYYESTLDSLHIHHTQSMDTIYYLDLYVVPEMKVTTDSLIPTCGRANDVAIPLYFKQGKRQFDGSEVLVRLISPTGTEYDSIQSLPYEEDRDTLFLTLPQYVQPDYYRMEMRWVTKSDTLDADPCPVDPMVTTLLVCYDSTVIDQKLGFVSLLNQQYSYGGWVYDSIQWYRDDELIPGATRPYIHATDSDVNHSFHVALSRPGEKTVITSCPIVYTGVRSVPLVQYNPAPAPHRVAPTLVSRGETFYVTGTGQAAIYGVVGSGYKRVPLVGDGLATAVKAPLDAGVYYIVFDDHDSQKILVY